MSLPILLLHGFPFDGSMWRRQVEFLRANANGAFRVVAPDLPGFGSPAIPAPPPESASIESYADVIQAAIGELGGRAIVGGFSMGGYILLTLLRLHPQMVAGAMFISTRADSDSPEARANRLKSIDDVRAHGTAGLVETMIARLLGPDPSAALKDEMRTLMSRQSPAAVIAAQSAMARRRDQTDLLPQFKVPTLIIAGKQDVVSPPSVAQAMQAKLHHCRLVEIPNAGHMTPLEAPEAVAIAIRDFANSIP